MKKTTKSLRSQLGRARGLGSAGHGTEHWLTLRFTSLLLIPLSLYVLYGFFTNAIAGGYDGAAYWLRSPFSSTFVVLFIAIAFHHAANGLQVVIEDYVHCEAVKLMSMLLVKFLCLTLAVLGILSVVKVLFGV